jgi:hypothetical protein
MDTNTSIGDRKVAHTLTPAYFRAAEIYPRYGLKRSFIYKLIKDGRLKSICMKARGKTRGIRLFRPEDIEKAIQELSGEV